MEYTTEINGQKFQVTGPDGLSAEEVKQLASAKIDAGEVTDTSGQTIQPLSAGSYERKPFSPEPPGVMARVGRGVADVTQGIEQIGRRMFGDDTETADWEAQRNRDLTTYETGAEKGLGGDFDIMRLGGNVGIMAPLAMVPGGTSIGSRIGYGMLAGGAGGGSLYAPTDDRSMTGDFLVDKVAQTGLGAGVGAAASAAAPYVIRSVALLPTAAKNLWNKMSPNVRSDMIIELSEEMGQGGAAWSALADDVRASMIDDAVQQMNTAGKLDAASIVRKQNIERFYDTPESAPLTGQVTRNPQQWQMERNLSKMEDVGEPIRNRLVAQNQQAMKTVEDYAERFGIEMDPADVGAGFRTTGRALAATSQKTVGKAYDDAAALAGVRDPISGPKNLAVRLDTVLDEFEDLLPPPVARRLKDFLLDENPRPMTVREINQAIKLVNRQKNIRGTSDAGVSRSMDEVSEALRQALDETAQFGGPAAQGLRQASRLAAQRFGLIRGGGRDKSTFIEGVLNGKRVDNMVKNRVITGNLDDLEQVKRFLLDFDEGAFPGIPKADAARVWEQIRASVIREMNKKAGYNADPSRGQLSGIQLQKAWRALGDRRMRILYNEEERALIRDMTEAIVDMTYEPPFSAVNSSNTAAGLGNMARRVLRVPGLGPLLDVLSAAGTVGRNISIKVSGDKKVAGAMAGNAATQAERLAREQFLRRLLGSTPALGAGQGVNQALGNR